MAHFTEKGITIEPLNRGQKQRVKYCHYFPIPNQGAEANIIAGIS